MFLKFFSLNNGIEPRASAHWGGQVGEFSPTLDINQSHFNHDGWFYLNKWGGDMHTWYSILLAFKRLWVWCPKMKKMAESREERRQWEKGGKEKKRAWREMESDRKGKGKEKSKQKAWKGKGKAMQGHKLLAISDPSPQIQQSVSELLSNYRVNINSVHWAPPRPNRFSTPILGVTTKGAPHTLYVPHYSSLGDQRSSHYCKKYRESGSLWLPNIRHCVKTTNCGFRSQRKNTQQSPTGVKLFKRQRPRRIMIWGQPGKKS
jgi:hypothetical protein